MANAEPPLRPLSRRRAWAVIISGLFLVAIGLGLIVFFAYLESSRSLAVSPSEATLFFRRMDSGLTWIIVSGVFAVVNASLVLRTGRPNVPVTIAVLLAFAAAVCTRWTATKALPGV